MLLFFKPSWKMSKSVPNFIILPWFYTYIKSMLLSKAYMNIPDFSPDLELFIQRKKKEYVFSLQISYLQKKIKAAKKQRFMVAFEVFSKPLLKLIHFLIPSFPSTYLCTFTNHYSQEPQTAQGFLAQAVKEFVPPRDPRFVHGGTRRDQCGRHGGSH